MNKRLIAIIFVIAIHLQIATSSNEKTTSRLIKKESRLRNERNINVGLGLGIGIGNGIGMGFGSGGSNNGGGIGMGFGRGSGSNNGGGIGMGVGRGSGSNNGGGLGNGVEGGNELKNEEGFGIDHSNQGKENDVDNNQNNINHFKIVRFNDPVKMVYAATIYEESKGEGFLDMLAVASVIRTRVLKNQPRWGGNKIRSVCTHPNQLSAWKNGVIKIRDVPKFKKALEIVDKITKNTFIDPTDGADNYNKPATEGIPEWVKGDENMSILVGKHQFYKS